MNSIIKRIVAISLCSLFVFLISCSSDTRNNNIDKTSESATDSFYNDQQKFGDVNDILPNSVLSSYESYSEVDEIIDNYFSSLPQIDSSFNYNDNPEASFWEIFMGWSINMEARALSEILSLYKSPSEGVDMKILNEQRDQVLLELQRATALIAPPEIEQIVNRPLTINEFTVPVKIDRRANRYIGMVTCASGSLVIVMARNPDPSYRINPYAFLFFREHEFAHISKGHIECVDGRPIRSGGKDQEHEADCEAVRVLKTFSDGERVADRAWSILNSLPMGDTPTHPAPSKRASHIDENCNG